MIILVPIGLDCLVLVAVGWLYHRFSGHSYPHVPAAKPANLHGTRDVAPALRASLRVEDVDAALAEAGEAFDIGREDLLRLLQRVETHAVGRLRGDLTCADIMSRDVLAVEPGTDPATARGLLLDHNVRALPVCDDEGRLVGTVGLRELLQPAERVADVMTEPARAWPHDPAFGLVARLTEGSSHAVMIVERDGRLAGIVTQTDLLSTLARAQVRQTAMVA